MRRALKEVLTIPGALAVLVAASGCGSDEPEPVPETVGPAPGLDAGDAAATRGADAGDAGSTQDAATPRPYAVGHVNYAVWGFDAPFGHAGNMAISVWYPVDPRTVTAATPPARYPLDPFSNRLPVSKSTDWEALGYDRAYEETAPSSAGPFPLLLVSPGAGDNSWEYMFIGTGLASHGFVVAAVDYQGDGQWPWAAGSPPAVRVLDRTGAVSAAITYLLAKSGAGGELLNGTIDASRIAVGGHSLGAHAAYALAGGDDEFCDDAALVNSGWDTGFPQATCGPTPQDPRVRAIVTMDGVSWYMHYRELARISVPSLIIGETIEHSGPWSGGAPTWDPDFPLWIARPHAAIGRSDSYRVDVTIANHWSFCGWCDAQKVMSNLGVTDASGFMMSDPQNWVLCTAQGGFDPSNNPITRQIVTTYMLAFLNTHLGRVDQSGMLTSDYAAKNQPQVEFFDSETCSASLPSAAYYTYRPHAGQCQIAQQDPAQYFAASGTDGGNDGSQSDAAAPGDSGAVSDADVTDGDAGE